MTTILVDAWRTVVPPADDKHGPLAPLLLALTVVTGLVDAFSYLVLGQVFVANMTGNVVFLAFALAGAGRFSILASLVAVVSFSLGALIGGRFISRAGAHRGRLLTQATALEAALLAGAVIVTAALHGPESGPGRHLLILLLALAMGLQNATARGLAVPDLTTTVLTLTITGISADARLVGGAGSRMAPPANRPRPSTPPLASTRRLARCGPPRAPGPRSRPALLGIGSASLPRLLRITPRKPLHAGITEVAVAVTPALAFDWRALRHILTAWKISARPPRTGRESAWIAARDAVRTLPSGSDLAMMQGYAVPSGAILS
jgi:hypothetical protein